MRGLCTLLTPLLSVALVLAMIVTNSSQAQAQMPQTVVAVNVSAAVVRAGLSLTRIAVAEAEGHFAILGTFYGRGKKLPHRVVVNVVTSSGKHTRSSAVLQDGPLNNKVFIVFLPRENGTVKLIDLSL